jgi:hypothetical protein
MGLVVMGAAIGGRPVAQGLIGGGRERNDGNEAAPQGREAPRTPADRGGSLVPGAGRSPWETVTILDDGQKGPPQKPGYAAIGQCNYCILTIGHCGQHRCLRQWILRVEDLGARVAHRGAHLFGKQSELPQVLAHLFPVLS